MAELTPIDTICKTIRVCFICVAAIVVVPVFSVYGLAPFAGATTTLNATVFADVLIDQVQKCKDFQWFIFDFVAFLIGITGFLFGFLYRKQYHNLVDYRSARAEKLGRYKHEETEKDLNQSRTSSNLTDKGETRPEDK